jgi:hypothetical protein
MHSVSWFTLPKIDQAALGDLQSSSSSQYAHDEVLTTKQ